MRATKPPRLRRPGSLIAYWQDGAFVIENYVTGTAVRAEPALARLLDRFQRPRSASGIDPKILRVLLGNRLLVPAGGPDDALDRRLHREWPWGPDAKFFHFATQSTRFLDSGQADRELRRRARRSPPPSPFLSRSADRTPLPPTLAPDGPFWSTLLERRTRRSFSNEALDRERFSRILQWTWGMTRRMRDSVLGEYVLKTSPSGGARHAIEVYPLVLNVQGLTSGVYHYSVREHALERLPATVRPRDLVRLCAGQPWVREASAAFVMTAFVKRSAWKYHQSQAYRVLHLDAGHLGQTFHLVCTRLGVNPLTTAALDAAFAGRLLGLDPVREFALYAAFAGPPGAARQTPQPG